MNVLITGAGTGIGRALAERLLRRQPGTHVIAVGRRRALLAQLQAAWGDQVTVIQADLGNDAERARLINDLLMLNMTVDMVVHNAASEAPVTRLNQLSLADYRQQQAINTEAPLFLTQQLLAQGIVTACRFLFVSSGAAYAPFEGLASYCISKAALEMVCQTFRQEYETAPVYFASLRPGGVHTPMAERLCKMPITNFPTAPQATERMAAGTLLAPDKAAQFMEKVLFNTTNEQFERHWNINDLMTGHFLV